MKIKVLYEDANILAIDKPAGILVHPDLHSKNETILDIFKKKYPKLEIAHRLDRDTSGVMLLAKNPKAHEFLKKQFSARTIKKTYVAIVNGSLKEERGVISKPIGRSPSDFRKYTAARSARGQMREAITRYKVLKRFTTPAPLLKKEGRNSSRPVKGESSKREGVKFTFVEVFPKTGRTHQIRVHMKSIGHAVVGDKLYNPKGAIPKGNKRMALHAKAIEFTNLKGKKVTVESPLPNEFKKAIK